MHRHYSTYIVVILRYACMITMTFITKTSASWSQMPKDSVSFFPVDYNLVYPFSFRCSIFRTPSSFIKKKHHVSLQNTFQLYHLDKEVRLQDYLLFHRVPSQPRTQGGFSPGAHALPETPCQFPTETPNHSLPRVNTQRLKHNNHQ